MTVAFIGHRKIERSAAMEERLTEVITALIESKSADTFLFGSRSEFNDLCYEVVSKLKEKYTHIRRVYVRAEYEYINKSYTDYLLESYEETFFHDKVHGAGKLSYIKRNQVMIDMCDVLISYCNMDYRPKTMTKSGTVMAVSYAQKKNKRLINLFEPI